jgi:ABC-2 type transport system ATP-binding protein
VLVRVEEVVKHYSTKIAVAGISLTLHPGRVLGLLGPNGAGKTTLIRMLTAITRPDSGAIWFRNEPLSDRHQRFIGYMPEERGLYRKMEVAEQIGYLLQLKGLTAAEARAQTTLWLRRLELEAWATRKVEELSKGMQQKVQFIATVAHRPQLLILDEPFSGLDPVNAQVLQDLIMELRDAGTAIIFSTHRMEQVETFCDDLILVNGGRIALQGTVAEVYGQHRLAAYTLETTTPLDPAQLPTGWELQADPRRPWVQTLRTPTPDVSPNDVLRHCLGLTGILKFEQQTLSLREIFVQTVAGTLSANGSSRAAPATPPQTAPGTAESPDTSAEPPRLPSA